MGRPINPKKIGELIDAGEQIRVVGILEIGTGLEELYITEQASATRYKCADPSDTRTGIITLQQATPVTEGEGRIEVSPFGASTATATATMKVNGFSKISGGTGYTVNDILTVSGGSPNTSAQIQVVAVSSGIITSFVGIDSGDYDALPTNPVSVTGGTGSGATFNLTWGVLAITVTDGGSGYDDPPAITITGAGGSGATGTATLTGDAVDTISVDSPGTGFTVAAAVAIEGSKEFARIIHTNNVKTFEGNTYTYRLDVAAAAIGEADIDSA